jgi:hypothetical protein
MSRFTRHSLTGLPEPLPDSPGGANQEGVVRKVFALRRCAPVPGCAVLGRCAPCRPLPSRPCGAPAGCALGAAPLAVGHPLRGPLRGRASAFPGSPAQVRSAQPVSGRGVALSRCSTAVPSARPLPLGRVVTHLPARSRSGAGALPPPQHAPLSLRSQLAAFMRRLPQRPAACTGLRPHPRTAPAFSLRSQLAGYAGGRLPLPADRSGDRPAASACGSAWPGAWWPVPPTGSGHAAAEPGRFCQCGACIS